MDDDEVTRETRVRYLHHDKYRGAGSGSSSGSLKSEEVSIQNNGRIQGGHGGNKLTLASKETDTIVMETLENNVAHTLRLLNLNLKRITPHFFNSYGNVQRLEVGCPVSVAWMFRYLPYMRNLAKVRFGRQAMCYEMNEFDDASTHKFRPSPSVQLLEVSYDVEEYQGLDDEKKQRISSKIKLVLSLAPENFPTLAECHLTLPKGNEVDLDSFLSHFPGLRASGEKRAKYSQGYVQFISTKTPRRSSTSDSKEKDRRRSASDSVNKAPEIPSKRQRGESLPSVSQTIIPIEPKNQSHNTTTDAAIKEDVSQIMRDPRKHRTRSDSSDVICLSVADSPSSSGIPADTDGHPHIPVRLPHTAIGSGGSSSGSSYTRSSSYNYPSNANTGNSYRVPRGPNSSESGSESDFSAGRRSAREHYRGGGSPSMLDYSRRSDSPEYIRPNRCK